MSECYTEWNPTARREYKCALCSKSITVGEKYERRKWLDAGHWYELIICLDCVETIKEMAETKYVDSGDDGIYISDLILLMHEFKQEKESEQ